MSFPGYAKHKDAGVEWLGQVPEHWEIKQLKWMTMFQRGHDLPSDVREPGSVPVVSSSGVSDTHSTAIARAPGIVTGRYGTIGEFHLVEKDYWPLNTTLYSVNLRGSDPKFMLYLLSHLAPLFVLNSVKSAVPGVDRNDIHPLTVAAPSCREQLAIAAFLDRETAKIDALVEEQGRLIELLKEKRQAVISHAVTKGLDPAAPLKDSGVEWLGQVPEHWEVVRNKAILYEVDDRSETGDEELLTVSHITGVTRRSEKSQHDHGGDAGRLQEMPAVRLGHQYDVGMDGGLGR